MGEMAETGMRDHRSYPSQAPKLLTNNLTNKNEDNIASRDRYGHGILSRY
jgi:hypothetical protein